MEPILPPEEGENVGDEAKPPANHENEAQNVGQESVEPEIVSDAISEQVDPGSSVSLQDAEGTGGSSALQVKVQDEAEGDGVVSGAVQAEVHVEGGGDGVVTQRDIQGGARVYPLCVGRR
ncbi:hypothetical protein RHGRI_011073 [Rhododendron griersonianum]|uniref:Uncharacterized protein n=1 Tax=Rhododendron griersonianum TaxID=479676 RepID=A0AAV6KLA4_9ERIC|nr:hypothetical protein RHGRI_011073 [Rhododendron griersonianum]